MNSIELILDKIGLTGQESRVYLALLELQESKTGVLCKFTKIASSNIYNILDSLINKGLVSYRVQNNIKTFMPAPPETLNELFLEKQRKLEKERKEVTELVANLKKREIKKEPYSNYKYYEGIVGIKSLWHEINDSLKKLDKKTIVKIYTARKRAYAILVAFYDEFHKVRVKNDINLNMILPFEGKLIGEKRKKQLAKIKYIDLKNDAEWGVVGDMFFIQYITAKVPRAFLIKDKIFAKTHEQVFDQLWENINN